MSREEYRSSLVDSQPVSSGFYQPLHLAKNKAWSLLGTGCGGPRGRTGRIAAARPDDSDPLGYVGQHLDPL